MRDVRSIPGACCAVLALLSVVGLTAEHELPLIDAARSGNTAAVRALVKRGVDVNAAEADGATALHWAAERDVVDVAELLLQAGARPNAANDYGVTPLALASNNGSLAMAMTLLRAGANPNVTQWTGETPMMAAARTGKAEVVSALLAAGANVNAAEERKGQTPLMWAVAEQHADVARLLIDNGADVRARSKSGFTALLFAAREGAVKVSDMLLAAGSDVNEAATDGVTPLLVATVRGHTALAQFLLERGADPNRDAAGYTALHWAAGSWETTLNGAFGIGADEEWNHLGGLGEGKLDVVKALLAHGANPNARVAKQPARFGFSLFQLRLVGATPYLLAAMAGDVHVMRALVAAGADPALTTNEGTTALMVASGMGRVVGESRVTEADSFEAAKLARELGGDVNAANAAGETPLHGAAYIGANSIVEFLLERGAAVSPANKCGWTPLTIAEGVYHQGVVIVHESTAKLLRSRGGESSPELSRGSTGSTTGSSRC